MHQFFYVFILGFGFGIMVCWSGIAMLHIIRLERAAKTPKTPPNHQNNSNEYSADDSQSAAFNSIVDRRFVVLEQRVGGIEFHTMDVIPKKLSSIQSILARLCDNRTD